MNSLSKSELIGVVNEMFLRPQKLRFYFRSSFVWSTFLGFQTNHSLLFFPLFLWRPKDSIHMFLQGKESLWLSLKEVTYVSNVESNQS